jgi:hypothetical protein
MQHAVIRSCFGGLKQANGPIFQSDGENEEPAQWQHLALGKRQIHEQAFPHPGKNSNP